MNSNTQTERGSEMADQAEFVTTAKVKGQMIPVRHNTELDYLTVWGFGYETLRRMSKMVLENNGKLYTFTGWNSDRGEGYFKPTPPEQIVAIAAKRTKKNAEARARRQVCADLGLKRVRGGLGGVYYE
jgi:hypothetical protein